MVEKYEDISVTKRIPPRRPAPRKGEDPKAFADRLDAWDQGLAIEEIDGSSIDGILDDTGTAP
jgi:hypothetical protein